MRDIKEREREKEKDMLKKEKYNIFPRIYIALSPRESVRQSAADWLYSRTVMTKWFNYDPVVIHANSWRLLQPGECSIIGGQRRWFSFLALFLCERATTRRRNETFFPFSLSLLLPLLPFPKWIRTQTRCSYCEKTAGVTSFFSTPFSQSDPVLIFVTAASRSIRASDNFHFYSRLTD